MKDKKFDWTKIKKIFKLINEETRIQDPIDISYVYNGYSPLSVKFLETFLYSGGFSKIDDSKFSYEIIYNRVKIAPRSS